MRGEVVATGVRFGEGPVWCDDGTVVATSVCDGALFRITPATGAVERIAVTEGGPNAAYPASDGGFLVTQNGGLDFSKMGARVGAFADAPYRPVTPGLQRVDTTGRVHFVTADGFQAPNDLVCDEAGTVFFTDPYNFLSERAPGRVWALHVDGSLEVVADGFAYCNGIAREPDGTLVVVEGRGLTRLLPDGGRAWIVEQLGPGGGDGFCVDVEGRFYVASTTEHGVRVVEPDGTEVEFLSLEGDGLTTNCCFGGDDGRTLFATDAVPGHVVAWEGMPTPGLPLPRWPAPPA
ncbi:MAG: SMP-30/gluconolactonase/LRE family protein [Actinobacteria bacterium]|nr:SMP-30/gluconolactonase/LRE family protein [Actinomycetota bacterium]